jgi:hypothetical protein
MGGAGYCFYNEVGGDFRNVYFEDDSWVFNFMSIDEAGWDIITTWENCYTVTLDAEGQIATLVGSIPQGWMLGPLDPP